MGGQQVQFGDIGGQRPAHRIIGQGLNAGQGKHGPGLGVARDAFELGGQHTRHIAGENQGMGQGGAGNPDADFLGAQYGDIEHTLGVVD